MTEREAARRLDVLIPTVGRSAALAVLLAGLVGQEYRDLSVLVADQGRDGPVEAAWELEAVARVLAAQEPPSACPRGRPTWGSSRSLYLG